MLALKLEEEMHNYGSGLPDGQQRPWKKYQPCQYASNLTALPPRLLGFASTCFCCLLCCMHYRAALSHCYSSRLVAARKATFSMLLHAWMYIWTASEWSSLHSAICSGMQLAIALYMTCHDVYSSQRWVLSSPAVVNSTVTMSWESGNLAVWWGTDICIEICVHKGTTNTNTPFFWY